VNYRDDELNGKYELFYDNGQLRHYYLYKNGEEIERSPIYNEDGEQIEGIYLKGSKIKKKDIDLINTPRK